MLLAWSLGPLTAHAQDDPQRDPQLPEIAPREFEIRGQAQVSFPSLERQPLQGFASPPSVPTLPPQRVPHTNAAGYKQTLGDLPASLPEAPAVSSRLQTVPPLTRGSLSADLGRYLTRSVRGVLAVPVSGTETLAFEGQYDGTNGFAAYEDPEVDTPYNTTAATVRFESRRERLTFAADVHGFVDSYQLYGVQAQPGAPGAPPIPDRSGRSIGTDLRLTTDGALPVHVGLAFDQTGYETNPGTTRAAIPFDESRLALDGAVQFPVGISDVDLDARFATAGLNSGAFAGDVVAFDGGGDALAVRVGPYTVRAGVRLLAFRSLVDPGADAPGEVTATFIAPTVDASWTVLPTLRLYARNAPRLRMHHLAELHRRNPFVGATPRVQPTLETTNVESGVDVSAGKVRWQAYGGFRYAPSYLHFVPGPDDLGTGLAQGSTFAPAYDGARLWRAGTELALEGQTAAQATLRMELRNAVLTGADVAVPNVSSFLLEGATTLGFADRKGTVTLGASVEGPRYIDRREDEQVSALIDFDVDAAYAITPAIDVRLGLHNLGAVERWERYPRPPAVLTTGFRMHW